MADVPLGAGTCGALGADTVGGGTDSTGEVVGPADDGGAMADGPPDLVAGPAETVVAAWVAPLEACAVAAGGPAGPGWLGCDDACAVVGIVALMSSAWVTVLGERTITISVAMGAAAASDAGEASDGAADEGPTALWAG